MLAKIEAGGEAAALAYGRDLDGYDGDAIVSAEMIENAGKTVSDQLKDDIKFAYDRVTKFAEAQKASISEFETELSPGLWAGQKLIPIETAGCYVPGGRYAHVASAIMSIATAKVAGVENVIACSAPSGKDGPHPAILYAMNMCGADTILSLGGVQGLPRWHLACLPASLPGFWLARATGLWPRQNVCCMAALVLICLLVRLKLR